MEVDGSKLGAAAGGLARLWSRQRRGGASVRWGATQRAHRREKTAAGGSGGAGRCWWEQRRSGGAGRSDGAMAVVWGAVC
ncbi:UNVERIFIED_CONTAM: hypothetical protein Sradi_6985800 [Sesamum radiatum]|uniref:Uncharacterized protein n=1 Tax=Sesamum radiatum TaxID=300843 RepID=A0AAW2JE72_SESRA